jgi:hypothetical protein
MLDDMESRNGTGPEFITLWSMWREDFKRPHAHVLLFKPMVFLESILH